MSKGVSSIRISLKQDILDEVAKLIAPIAESYVLEMKMEDVQIQRAIPLLGQRVVASAKDIYITNFDIKGVRMPICDGFVAVEIEDVDVKIAMDLKTVGAKLGTAVMEACVDVHAKIKFDLVARKLKADVFDTSVSMQKFETTFHQNPAGSALAAVTESLESLLKGSIESKLADTVRDSLASGLDSIFTRNWDVLGSVSSMFYKFEVEFLTVPRISTELGVEYDIGIDSTYKEGGPVEENVVPPLAQEQPEDAQTGEDGGSRSIAAQHSLQQGESRSTGYSFDRLKALLSCSSVDTK